MAASGTARDRRVAGDGPRGRSEQTKPALGGLLALVLDLVLERIALLLGRDDAFAVDFVLLSEEVREHVLLLLLGLLAATGVRGGRGASGRSL